MTRYSIRSLLVLVTVSCVVLGWYVPNKREHDRQQLALGRLGQMCMRGKFDWAAFITRQGDGRTGGCSIFTGGQNVAELRYAGSTWLGNCLSAWGYPVTLRVTQLEITTTELDDSAIPHLVQLASLEMVSIEQSRFTPEGEARLRRLLPETTITLTPYHPDDGT